MKVFAVICVLLLSACVSMPIPPVGEDIGKLGRLELRLVYVPNVAGTLQYLIQKKQPSTKGFAK